MESDEESGVTQFQAFIRSKDFIQASKVQITKGKYYKQTYRPAWEQMPDFKGWLQGIPEEPTRAFCLFCEKSLHAHRLSLLKHTCTIRHQKAAQINYIRQQNNKSVDNEESNMDSVDIVIAGSSHDENEELQNTIELETIADEAYMQDQEDIEEEELEEEEEQEKEQIKKKIHPQVRAITMSGVPVISTHVLDTSKGLPVSGLQVSLYKLIDGRWTYINEGLTNPDGRFSNFMSRDAFTAGRYKLHFDVDRYFELRKQDSMYPFIEIVFDCRAPGDHYHIPLLLGPFGYTTYRGT